MKRVHAILSIILTASILPQLGYTKPQEHVTAQLIKYAESNQCDKLRPLASTEQTAAARKIIEAIYISELIGMAAGKDALLNDFLENYRDAFKNKKMIDDITQLKERYKNRSKIILSYRDESYNENIESQAFSWVESHPGKNDRQYLFCELITALMGKKPYSHRYENFSTFVESRKQKANVGFFEIYVDSCFQTTRVNTGNVHSEPKQWKDSKFLVVEATFKNIDVESRLPVEGSAYINISGKEYKFDQSEHILQEGYGIFFNRLNPLVSMTTKIVYRIPENIHGEVFWEPGRNTEKIRLWCGSI